jgi:hypothetical protein
VASRILGFRAYIEHDRIASIHELHGLERTDLLDVPRERTVEQRPDKHAARHYRSAEQHHVPGAFLQKHEKGSIQGIPDTRESR